MALTAAQDAERRALHADGQTDTAIASAQGVGVNAICEWRVRRGLKANKPWKPQMSTERAAERRALYDAGLNDTEIADRQGVTADAIYLWRKRHALVSNVRSGESAYCGRRRRPHAKQTRSFVAISPMRDPLYAAVTAAIGRGLPRPLLDDIVSDAILDALEGRADVAAILAEARRYRSRGINAWASKRSRSIDQPLSDNDGSYTLLDRMPDPSSADWLERMGATVW